VIASYYFLITLFYHSGSVFILFFDWHLGSNVRAICSPVQGYTHTYNQSEHGISQKLSEKVIIHALASSRQATKTLKLNSHRHLYHLLDILLKRKVFFRVLY